MAPTRDHLLGRVAESIEELVDKIHDSLLKGRASDAQDYAMALSSATSAYRDLAESSDADS